MFFFKQKMNDAKNIIKDGIEIISMPIYNPLPRRNNFVLFGIIQFWDDPLWPASHGRGQTYRYCHLPTNAPILSWNSAGEIGRIGWHLADKPVVKVMMCFGPMPADASDFPGGIPAYDRSSAYQVT